LGQNKEGLDIPWSRWNNFAMDALEEAADEVGEGSVDVKDVALTCLAIVFCALWNAREAVSILGTRTYGKRTVVLGGTGFSTT